MKYVFSALIVVLIFNSCNVRKSSAKIYNTYISEQPFDAIIVPGITYDGKNWDDIMKIRVLWSKYLFEKGYTKNIIFSGAAVHTPYIESKIMGLYAEALGIPKGNIFTEEKAEHSTENVYYSYYLAKEKGFKNIALATDHRQTRNLISYIKKYNFELKVLPIQYDTVSLMDHTEPKIDPKLAMVDTTTFVSLKQRESFFKRLKGTLGKNIPYTAEDKKRKKGK